MDMFSFEQQREHDWLLKEYASLQSFSTHDLWLRWAARAKDYIAAIPVQVTVTMRGGGGK